MPRCQVDPPSVASGPLVVDIVWFSFVPGADVIRDRFAYIVEKFHGAIRRVWSRTLAKDRLAWMASLDPSNCRSAAVTVVRVPRYCNARLTISVSVVGGMVTDHPRC